VRLFRPLVDLVRYWRSLDLNWHIFYGLPTLLFGVLVIAAMRWWALAVLVPAAALVGYIFRFDDAFREQS
jgi:hypothetical protein